MTSLQASAAGRFKFSSPEGHELVRKILRPHFKYPPHDYQVEGVCKSLDGVHLLAIVRTGGGKTGFFLMYMLVLLAILQDNALITKTNLNIPQDPVIIIVYPTIGLEVEMVRFSITESHTLTVYPRFHRQKPSRQPV